MEIGYEAEAVGVIAENSAVLETESIDRSDPTREWRDLVA